MASNGDAATTTKRSGSHGGLSSCSDASRNLGNHLASRLVQLGVDTVFAVPGDYNLILLDQLIKDERLKVVYTCNELNAGYAADGYSRARGGKAACVVATFTVGGLSLLNAVAGAASESLPVICITGGPNSNDSGTNRVLHHTIGSSESFAQEMEAFRPFVCRATRIFALEDAHWQLDDAIAEALRQSKPVYINIACNIAGLSHPTFEREPIPFVLPDRHTNPDSLEAAVEVGFFCVLFFSLFRKTRRPDQELSLTVTYPSSLSFSPSILDGSRAPQQGRETRPRRRRQAARRAPPRGLRAARRKVGLRDGDHAQRERDGF